MRKMSIRPEKKRNFNENMSHKIAVNNSQNLNKFFKKSEAINFQEDEELLILLQKFINS